MEMISKGLPLRLDGDGTQSRDFVHVDDIVAANVFCMNYDKDFGGEWFDDLLQHRHNQLFERP